MKEIVLTQGKVALVDDDNYHELSKFKWYAKRHRRTFYAVRNIRIYPGYGGQRCLWMHRVILGDIKPPLQTDHIDGDGLNNQRSNLRIVTNRENMQNLHISKTSRFPGVSFVAGRKKPWLAHIAYGSTEQKTLGFRSTEEEAYALYCDAVARACGRRCY